VSANVVLDDKKDARDLKELFESFSTGNEVRALLDIPVTLRMRTDTKMSVVVMKQNSSGKLSIAADHSYINLPNADVGTVLFCKVL
jgi:hypothetical protein